LLSEVWAFLGTVGVLRIHVTFAHRVHILVKLTRKDVPFKWGEEQENAQEDLKEALLSMPALRPLDYVSNTAVIVAVDTPQITVGFFLCQCSQGNPKQRDGKRLWWKYSHGVHQLFIPKNRRIMVLRELHDNIGHRCFYVMCTILNEQFWWPHQS
jgi:hypothetical protein